MKAGQDFFPKSSFLSTDKDFALIVNKFLHNQRLLKLLYYTTKDCLSKPDLTEEQILSMVDKQIKIVPYLRVSEECPNYVIITFDNFTQSANPEFRDNVIGFDIICNPDHWTLGNFQLRPYKIAGEIDAMINKQKLTGIGEVNFVTGNDLIIDSDHMGLTLLYRTVHGAEDQIEPLS